jgi:hypothetical protein
VKAYVFPPEPEKFSHETKISILLHEWKSYQEYFAHFYILKLQNSILVENRGFLNLTVIFNIPP